MYALDILFNNSWLKWWVFWILFWNVVCVCLISAVDAVNIYIVKIGILICYKIIWKDGLGWFLVTIRKIVALVKFGYSKDFLIKLFAFFPGAPLLLEYCKHCWQINKSKVLHFAAALSILVHPRHVLLKCIIYTLHEATINCFLSFTSHFNPSNAVF